MENCIFCKIVAGDIPSPRLYEDEKMIVIKDIEPKAKLHYLTKNTVFHSITPYKFYSELQRNAIHLISSLKTADTPS